MQRSIHSVQSTALTAQHLKHSNVVQETPSNPSLDELHAEDVKDEEGDDTVEDAKKVADSLHSSFRAFVFLLFSYTFALAMP